MTFMRNTRKCLVGKVFYDLTVLEYIGSKPATSTNPRKRPWYKCQCVCGKIIEICGKYLTCNHTKSCGCRKIIVADKQINSTLYKGTRPCLLKSTKVRGDNITQERNICLTRDGGFDVSMTIQGKRFRKYFVNINEAIIFRDNIKEKYAKPIIEEYYNNILPSPTCIKTIQ